MLFICSDSDIISKGKSYNLSLYEGGVVELFLTLGDKTGYLEMELNPDGIEYAGVVENNLYARVPTYKPTFHDASSFIKPEI